MFVLHGFVEVTDERGVGPGLVRGVQHFPFPAANERLDDCILGRGLDGCPLLQLDDDDGFLLRLIQPRQNEIDALGGERNLVFNGNPGVIGDARADQGVVHVLHGVLPGLDLRGPDSVAGTRFQPRQDLLLDDVSVDVLGKLEPGAGIDDQLMRLLFVFSIFGGAAAGEIGGVLGLVFLHFRLDGRFDVDPELVRQPQHVDLDVGDLAGNGLQCCLVELRRLLGRQPLEVLQKFRYFDA